MAYIPGTIIYSCHDELGTIQVVEEAGQRSLHFDSAAKQSSLFLHDPSQLALSYIRAMTSTLLFNDQPEHILLIGLGGGSLATFLLHNFPNCHIDAIEYREKIVTLAREYFFLPDDSRLRIQIDDAAHFMWNADTDDFGGYDLILVDAFDARGIARSVCGVSFFDRCRERLSPNGMLSMNLWSGDYITADELLCAMKESFSDRILRLPVEDKENIIGLAHNSQFPPENLKCLDVRARELQRKFNIEYPAFLKAMRRSNRWLYPT